MKTFSKNDLTNLVKKNKQGSAEETESQSSISKSEKIAGKESEKLTLHLLNKLAVIYGGRLAKDEEAEGVWIEILAGLTVNQYKTGLESLKSLGSMYPPNPLYFRKLCIDADLGISVHDAYIEAANKANSNKPEWSQELVRLAAVNTGLFELRSMSERQIWPVFKRNFELLVDKIGRGEELDAPLPKAIDDKSTEIHFSEKEIASAKERFGKLRENLRG